MALPLAVGAFLSGALMRQPKKKKRVLERTSSHLDLPLLMKGGSQKQESVNEPKPVSKANLDQPEQKSDVESPSPREDEVYESSSPQQKQPDLHQSEQSLPDETPESTVEDPYPQTLESEEYSSLPDTSPQTEADVPSTEGTVD